MQAAEELLVLWMQEGFPLHGGAAAVPARFQALAALLFPAWVPPPRLRLDRVDGCEP